MSNEWSNYESINHLFFQKSLTPKEFSKCVYVLMERIRVSSGKSAHHFQFPHAQVDLLYRDSVLISISRNRHLKHDDHNYEEEGDEVSESSESSSSVSSNDDADDDDDDSTTSDEDTEDQSQYSDDDDYDDEEKDDKKGDDNVKTEVKSDVSVPPKALSGNMLIDDVDAKHDDSEQFTSNDNIKHDVSGNATVKQFTSNDSVKTDNKALNSFDNPVTKAPGDHSEIESPVDIRMMNNALKQLTRMFKHQKEKEKKNNGSSKEESQLFDNFDFDSKQEALKQDELKIDEMKQKVNQAENDDTKLSNVQTKPPTKYSTKFQELFSTPDSHSPRDLNSWIPVVRHYKKNKINHTRKDFYFFRDAANSNFIDFVGIIHGLPDLFQAAKKEIYSHGFCLETSTVFDFNFSNDYMKPKERSFSPNKEYLLKINTWLNKYKALEQTAKLVSDGDVMNAKVDITALDQTRNQIYYIYTDSSVWHEWNFLSKENGLAATREKIKRCDAHWAHAYCEETNDIYNFTHQAGKFIQKQSKGDVFYIERFQKWKKARLPMNSSSSPHAILPLIDPPSINPTSIHPTNVIGNVE